MITVIITIKERYFLPILYPERCKKNNFDIKVIQIP